MKKILNVLISTRTMAVLLILFAGSMAVATFVENAHGTPTAKALIYNTKWFELIMLLLVINFCGNIKRYKLYTRRKWPVLMFHLAFIFLFIGGAITRYISFEGMMTIREGQSSNQILSDKGYMKVQIEDQGDVLSYPEVPYIMSPLHHDFAGTYDYRGDKFHIQALNYIQRKKDSLLPNPSGKQYLKMVSTGSNGRQNLYIAPGETKDVNGTLVTFNNNIEGAVEIHDENGQLELKSPQDGKFMTMATSDTGVVKKDQLEPLKFRSLYSLGDLQLVFPDQIQRGTLKAFEGDKFKDTNLNDMLTVKVTNGKESKIVDVPVSKSDPNLGKQVTINGHNLMIGYGPKVINLPFSLHLDKFVMETYPGSNSPSAYESHLTIMGKDGNRPYKIYMNHILDHDGYRFFQAGFDPDRQGTHLSVNHDWWGTHVTYFGYTLLFAGMLLSLVWPGTRFTSLNKMLKTISKKKVAIFVFFLLSIGFVSAQNTMQTSEAKREKISQEHNQGATAVIPENQKMPVISPQEVIKRMNISKAHADKFGYALVQNIEGRIVPINTLALDALRKIYKKDTFYTMDANQWFLAININPFLWTQVPIIKVSTRGGEEMLKRAGVNKAGYTTLVNLFPLDKSGRPKFVFEDDYKRAFEKSPAQQTTYDQAVIALNDQLQAFNGILSGQYMRVVPVPNDTNHTWSSWLNPQLEPDENSQKVLGPYFASVLDASQTGNWSKADYELNQLEKYQNKWGAQVIPSKLKTHVEVLMNQLNITMKLLILYTFVGGLLLVLGFIYLFKPSRFLKISISTVMWIGILGYAVHFLSLVGRWYVSGHAPWSTGYEAILFISWVGITAGLLLYKNSNALIPAAGFLVAVIMMGFALGGAQLNPQITPLEPVLKSYWLIVHVAVITSSYGFFGLSTIIAAIVLSFYILANKRTFKAHNNKTVRELTVVSEMSLEIGVIALTIGNFLGGIWANESWGRYWSWDPKETWAFISIILYSFVIHMRIVKGLQGVWTYHAVTLFAFSTMVMTYFGVNYYLTGLHSYAAGEPLPVPMWVYLGLAFMFTLSAVAYFRYKRMQRIVKEEMESPHEAVKKEPYIRPSLSFDK